MHGYRRPQTHARPDSFHRPLLAGHETLLASWTEARTVADVALGYSILQGPDGVDPYFTYARDAEPADPRVAGQPVRVGWISDEAFAPVDPEVTAAVVAGAAQLKDLGCEVEEVRLPFMKKDWLTTFFTIWYAEMIPCVQSLTAGSNVELHAVMAALKSTPLPSLVDFVAAEAGVEELKSAFAGYFQKYDVLLCPVMPLTAPRHNQNEVVVNGVTVSAYHILKATAPFNMTGLPRYQCRLPSVPSSCRSTFNSSPGGWTKRRSCVSERCWNAPAAWDLVILLSNCVAMNSLPANVFSRLTIETQKDDEDWMAWQRAVSEGWNIASESR